VSIVRLRQTTAIPLNPESPRATRPAAKHGVILVCVGSANQLASQYNANHNFRGKPARACRSQKNRKKKQKKTHDIFLSATNVK
jgi:hypothetical protein